MKTSVVALVVTLAVLASGVSGASFTVEIGGTFDDNCGKAYAASAAATCSFISKMNGGKGVAIGPNKDFFLKFNFDFALYPKDGYFTNDVGVNMATAMYAKSHLIVWGYVRETPFAPLRHLQASDARWRADKQSAVAHPWDAGCGAQQGATGP